MQSVHEVVLCIASLFSLSLCYGSKLQQVGLKVMLCILEGVIMLTQQYMQKQFLSRGLYTAYFTNLTQQVGSLLLTNNFKHWSSVAHWNIPRVAVYRNSGRGEFA